MQLSPLIREVSLCSQWRPLQKPPAGPNAENRPNGYIGISQFHMSVSNISVWELVLKLNWFLIANCSAISLHLFSLSGLISTTDRQHLWELVRILLKALISSLNLCTCTRVCMCVYMSVCHMCTLVYLCVHVCHMCACGLHVCTRLLMYTTCVHMCVCHMCARPLRSQNRGTNALELESRAGNLGSGNWNLVLWKDDKYS